MSIHAVDKNMFVKNVIVDYRDRPAGSVSKLNTFTDGFKVIMTILRLWRTYRPGAFFGAIAAVLALLSVGLFIPVLSKYIATGLVTRLPTAVLCGFLMIAAIQSAFAGLILQTIYQKNRQDFEMELCRVTRQQQQETTTV